MLDVLKQVDKLGARSHRHNDTLLVHDMEIEAVLARLDIPRVRRQAVQE